MWNIRNGEIKTRVQRQEIPHENRAASLESNWSKLEQEFSELQKKAKMDLNNT